MSGFTKLFGAIVYSTIWREAPHTKIVWITMLALADQHGQIMSSVPGLADAARVTIPECEEALERLLAPDPYSRTTDNEGRRIEAVDGGWGLLNYEKYRDMRQAEERKEQVRKAVQKHRQKVKARESAPVPTPDFATAAELSEVLESAGFTYAPSLQIVVAWMTEYGAELIRETLIDCEDKFKGKNYRYFEKILTDRRDNPIERPIIRRARNFRQRAKGEGRSGSPDRAAEIAAKFPPRSAADILAKSR